LQPLNNTFTPYPYRNQTCISIIRNKTAFKSYSNSPTALYFTSFSINLKKADITPAEQMLAYSETGAYITQKYFGSVNRKMKADEAAANQILGLDASGKPSYGVPLSNYMNAQVIPPANIVYNNIVRLVLLGF
jgi:hypothetical protein